MYIKRIICLNVVCPQRNIEKCPNEKKVLSKATLELLLKVFFSMEFYKNSQGNILQLFKELHTLREI